MEILMGLEAIQYILENKDNRLYSKEGEYLYYNSEKRSICSRVDFGKHIFCRNSIWNNWK